MIDKLIVVIPSKLYTIVLKYICFYKNPNNNRIQIIIYKCKYIKYKLVNIFNNNYNLYRFISF